MLITSNYANTYDYTNYIYLLKFIWLHLITFNYTNFYDIALVEEIDLGSDCSVSQ